jgi:hypothetical protein
MTNKGAIETLNRLSPTYPGQDNDAAYMVGEALTMGIEALKSDGDTISRTDTLERFKKLYFDDDTVIRCAELVLGGMPSVQPKAKWIRTSERVPDHREWYLGIFKETDTGWVNGIPFVCEYIGHDTKCTTKDFWVIMNGSDVEEPFGDYYRSLECVAWTELPKWEGEEYAKVD